MKRPSKETLAKQAKAEATISPFLKKAREEIIDLFIKSRAAREAFTLSTAVKTSVKLEDGGYKVAVLPQTDYTLTSAYYGKRGNPIFNFTPLDAQDFAHAELQIAAIGNGFPALIADLQEVLIDVDADLQAYNLVEANPADALNSMIDGFIERRVAELTAQAEEVEAKAKSVDEDFYATNPNWGLF